MSHETTHGKKPERIRWDGKVSFRLYHHKNERPFINSKAGNIGDDGLLIFSRDPLPLNSILILKLYRYQDYAPFKILARVCSAKMNESEDAFEVDCQYYDLSPTDRMTVQELIEEVNFIQRVHKKVQETLQINEMNQETKPAAKKPAEKHGSKRP